MIALEPISGEPGYYGMPMLKKPLWGWEIAVYFFGEGISSGCYVLATAADFFGGRRYRKFVRAARLISLATMIPCPPLLIADLGRPERFLHMLRVFKPSSPMNLGAWSLAAFGVPVTALALLRLPKFVSLLGLPPAFIMMSYPGVLLSTTSTPLWMHTRALGPLLASSSMVTAAAALALVSGEASGPMRSIEKAAHICEAGALAAWMWQAHEVAGPLKRGRSAGLFWAGAVGCGLVAPWLINRAQGRKPGRLSTVCSALLTLAGGLALKWTIVHAGRASAHDGDAAREVSRPRAAIRAHSNF